MLGGAEGEGGVAEGPEDEVDGALMQDAPQTALVIDARPAVLPQVYGTLATAITHMGMGTILGFSGITLPQLTDTNSSDLVLNTFQVAIFSSVINLGAAVGCIVGGLPLVRIGQRLTLLAVLPVALLAWFTLFTSQHIWVIVAARAVLGITMGITASSSVNYIVELADSSLRGRLVALLNISRYLGYLFIYAVGSSALTWREVALVCGCVTTVPPFVGLLFLPDSPRWLATRDRLEEAYRSLVFFRGPDYNSIQELNSILAHLDQSRGSCKSTRDQLRRMRQPAILRSSMIIAFLHLTMAFSGSFVISAYLVTIFDATHVNLNSYYSAVVIGLVRIVGVSVNILFIDLIGRKPLLITSCSVCGACLFMLGGFFYDQTFKIEYSEMWVPLVCLSVYIFFSSLGFPVVELVLGEFLPTTVRATAVSILYTILFVGVFTAVQTYPYIANAVGKYGAFWVYGACNFLMAIVSALTLTETRGQTLEQISERQQARS
ncbi:facilitated trehalose transporter Tret1-like [Penaeus japonicus]|uniref:facilitated trehalose transporter Tret1-like n=1 Tax=Penaeus japonicus TaxID=27405 RepID=UPI001C711720|nr:facilitated trehalose transporter Tret1-like [Penaeus japonicus]